MIHTACTLAVLIAGAVITTALVIYLRSNADRIASALQGRPIRPHD